MRQDLVTGHAFAVQADLTRLVCDEVLLPTDRWLAVGAHWAELRPLTDASALPAGWREGRVRVTGLLPHVEGLPRRRMVNSGATEHDDVPWLVRTLGEALQVSARELAEQPPRSRRARPLLALPLLGTGAGGYAQRRGDVIDALLDRCEATASDTGVDIALVCHARSDFTAVQARRSRRQRSTSAPVVELAGLAKAGALALFLGAGVSVGAGLPGWTTLLKRIAEEDSRTQHLPARWDKRVDPWQAAEDLREALGPECLQDAVERQLSQRRFSLSHALLASLPGREIVTTNFDALFEEARRVRVTPALEVLPYDRRGAPAYLLKLHGDAGIKDVVLDRETLETYDRDRRPLAGLLQGLLLTRHLLFVGSSMTDENVIRNVDEVARLVKRLRHAKTVGTILTLTPDAALRKRWRDRGFAVHAAAAAGTSEVQAARDLEILLDALLLEATYDEGAHLLDPVYEALLDEQQRQVARDLRAAAARVPRSHPEWQGLRDALQAHGAPRE